jgi:hypothetical protein
MKKLLLLVLAALALVGFGYIFANSSQEDTPASAPRTEFDEIVVVLREKRNRLEVLNLAGTMSTTSRVRGGIGDLLRGSLTVKQPWAVTYLADMGDLTLEDYIYDAATRTLIVRAPAVSPAAPNIDESKAVVTADGAWITDKMHANLRKGVAEGAIKQATDEAAKPENMAAATLAAQTAIKQNLEIPLRVAGLKDVSILVRPSVDKPGNPNERWDVSRSIAEVLAERAGG